MTPASRRRRQPTGILVLILLAAACTTPGSGDSTTSTEALAPGVTGRAPGTTSTTQPALRPGLIAADCGFDDLPDRTVECSWLEVPADRDDPGGETILLHVAVVRSESTAPRPDPVVYLEGGPGGNALEALPFVFEESFAHLLADRDLVFFDQRGTGYSEPSLACPEVRELGFELIDDVLTPEEYVERTLDVLEACRQRLVRDGALLDEYTSADSAADLADLRMALGVEEWNLYGISYGTRLALTTMRDHPEGIRSVILDSVYPPDSDIFVETPANLDRALRALFDGCASDPGCGAAFPDLETTFYSTVESLQRNPARAVVTNVFTGNVYEDAVFDGAAFGSIVFQGLYSAEVIPLLPRIISNVAAGDLYELSVLASSFISNGEFVSLGMQFSVQCNEEAVFSSRQSVEAAIGRYPRLETILAGAVNLGLPLFDVCDTWGAGAADPVENEAVISDIPTLVITGEYDPITPPAWGLAAADDLSNSILVDVPGVGHGPSARIECPQQIVRSFLNEPSSTDTSCVGGMGPPGFVTDSTTPTVNLVPFSDRYGGMTLSGVVPEEWENQAQGVWTRGLTGLDQTTLVQQFAVGVRADILIRSIGAQFGIEPGALPGADHRSGVGSWAIHEGLVAGTPALVALTEPGGGTVIVILIAAPSETARLRETVLLPVLDAVDVG